MLAGAPRGLLPTGPASVGEKLAAKQWGSRGERAGMSGAETDAGEPEGLGERDASRWASIISPSLAGVGEERSGRPCVHPFPGRLRHSAVSTGPSETIQLLPPKSFLKTKQSTNTVASVHPEPLQGAQKTDWKGKGAPHLRGHPKSSLPITDHTRKRNTTMHCATWIHLGQLLLVPGTT